MKNKTENDEFLSDLNKALFSSKKRPKDNSGKELEKLLKEIELLTRPLPAKKKKKKKKTESGGGRSNYSWTTSRKQLCIVKCNYVKDSIKKHKAFLKFYMPQKNKETVENKPVLFNATEDIVTAKTLSDYEFNIMDKMFFRFVISPKRQDVPLKLLVRLFIKTVEKMTGYELYWFAAEHNDTLQKHCHLLINGKDKNGKEVHFDKAFFKSEFRVILQDLCTEMMGMRTDYEIQQDKEDRLRAKRWIKLDNDIKDYARPVLTSDKDFPTSVISKNYKMHARLKFFEKYGLAKQIDNNDFHGIFLLSNNWEMKLRHSLSYYCFEQMKNDFFLRENRELQYYYKDIGAIEGTIIQVIHQDFEYEHDNALIIEDNHQNVWYVPLKKEPPEGMKAGQSVFYNVGEASRPSIHSQVPSRSPKEPDTGISR